MYRLTNLTLDTITTYKNKDLVYQALDRENAKVKHLEAQSLLLVEELDKKGVVLSQEEIVLPFDGIADGLFLTKEKAEEKTEKPLPFWKKATSQTQEPVVSPLLPKEESTQKRKSLRLLPSLLFGMVTASFLALGYTVFLVLEQKEEMRTLSHQIETVQILQKESGHLDAMVRYFLPRYYSEAAELEDFVSSKLQLNHQPGQLQSVILENVEQTKDQLYHLTYVLSLKEEGTSQQKRLELTLQAEPTSPYGYIIVDQPKETTYP
ncbi:TPA: hypothetical protein U1C40_002348 [Streptococcus suis]|nr:hypothetical protein [Streptococcus suis]